MMHVDLFGLFVAGLLTFASPCVLPLVPVYLSVLAGASVDDLRAGTRTARAVRAALAFALGLTLVFVGLGLAASSIGRALLAHRTLLLQLGGLVVLLFGLKALGLLRLPVLERDLRPMLGRHRGSGSLLGALVFGAAFGLGWTPCIGPVLGSVLTYAAAQSSSSLAGASYLFAYAAGLSLPLVAVAAMAPLALRWHRRLLPHLRKLEVATGVLLVGVGLLLNTDSLDLVIPNSTPRLATTHGDTAQLAPSVASWSGNPLEPAVSQSGSCGLSPETSTPPSNERNADPAVADGLVGDSGPRLIEFINRACPVCQRMVPVLHAAERDCAGEGIEIIRVDVGDEAGLAASRRLRVRGVPTFVFLDGRGVEVARLVGEQPLQALEQSMAVLTGGRCDGFHALPSEPAGR
jgi:cytochrome c-type biogenesis protein